MSARQPAKAGDYFLIDGVRVRVNRCSRNPEKPWVDIDCYGPRGWMWSKRMPTGIPATWTRVDAAGKPVEAAR